MADGNQDPQDLLKRLSLTPLERYVVDTMLPPNAITPKQAAERRGVKPASLEVVRSNLRKRLRLVGIDLPDGRTTRGTVLRGNARRNGKPLVTAS